MKIVSVKCKFLTHMMNDSTNQKLMFCRHRECGRESENCGFWQRFRGVETSSCVEKRSIKYGAVEMRLIRINVLKLLSPATSYGFFTS